MAKVIIEDTTLTAIGNSIRNKTGKEDLLLPSEMPSEIESIKDSSSSGGIGSGISSSYFDGSYDSEGLKQIGWTDEEIEYYNKYGVQWYKEQNDWFKLTEDELLGNASASVRFFSKNSAIPTKFQNYNFLVAIPQLDTSSITDLNAKFSGCSSLTTIPLLDTSSVTEMGSMFNACYSLTSIPQLDTSNVTNMSSMFNGCNSLIAIPQLNTSNVTSMNYMFYNCNSLIAIPQLDASNVTSINGMLNGCYSLRIIGGFMNLGKSYIQVTSNYSNYTLSLTTPTSTAKESLLNIINNLYDLNLTYNVANGGTLYTQSLQIGTTNKAKLTAEEIAIATAKGWTVA